MGKTRAGLQLLLIIAFASTFGYTREALASVLAIHAAT